MGCRSLTIEGFYATRGLSTNLSNTLATLQKQTRRPQAALTQQGDTPGGDTPAALKAPLKSDERREGKLKKR